MKLGNTVKRMKIYTNERIYKTVSHINFIQEIENENPNQKQLKTCTDRKGIYEQIHRIHY